MLRIEQFAKRVLGKRKMSCKPGRTKPTVLVPTRSVYVENNRFAAPPLTVE
jgi:hypothetical protein